MFLGPETYPTIYAEAARDNLFNARPNLDTIMRYLYSFHIWATGPDTNHERPAGPLEMSD